MRLSTKDVVGIALVAVTGLVVLGRNRSAENDSQHGGAAARVDVGLASAGVAARPTVFFDFNLLPAGHEVPLPHQVVVVRSGRIERVGEVGAVAIPENARRIEGRGSAYLVPGPEKTLGAIEPGRLADLLLLERDPRGGVDRLRHPSGAMIHGRWYGRAEIDGVLAEIRTP